MLQADECLNSWGFDSSRDPFCEKYPFEEGFWALPGQQVRLMQFLLNATVKQRQVRTILVRGEYGTGKTYTLHFAQSLVEREQNGLGIYFQIQPMNQSKGFLDIYQEILREIKSVTLVMVGRKIIEEHKIKNFKEFEEFLQAKIPNKDLARALTNLTYDLQFALTWSWLKGETSAFQQRAIGFVDSPRNETVALEILVGLFDFLLLKFPIVAVCMDEMEDLGTSDSKTVRSIREGLRHLLDHFVFEHRDRSVIFFLSCTAELVFQLKATLGGPLIDRIDREIELKQLTDDEAKVFLLTLFSWSRYQHENSIVPFANEAALNQFIKYAKTTTIISGLGKTQLTPRRIIKTGKVLFEDACLDGKTTIDSEYILKKSKSQ